MNRIIRLATGDKIKVIDGESKYVNRTGKLVEPRRVPVQMKLEYHWLVKLDNTETTEIFAPGQLEKIDS